MTAGIFYSTRSILGREGIAIIRHLDSISNCCDEIDYLSNTKTNAVKQHIMEISNIKIKNSLNLFGEFYEKTALHMKSWMEIYDALDVDKLKKYDKLFIIGGMDFWRSGLTRFDRRSGVFPKDAGQIKFQSVGIHCINILSILKAHNEYGIPLHELSYDPNELCSGLFHSDVYPKHDYYLYHGYDIPKYNMLRLDSIQKHFESKSFKMFTKDKTTEFTFGYTILEKSNRQKFKNDIENIVKQFKIHNVYVKDYQTGVNTLIDGSSYLDKLEESKFTMVIPSYDKHSFSIYRFIEALYQNCLPLIHRDCNIDDVQKSFNIDLSPLVTDVPPSESQRLELLDYLKKFMRVEKNFK